MFQFTGFPSVHYGFMYGYMLFSMCVPAFRHPRVTGYVLLTVAFRSLSRLSSALSARASAPRPFLLKLFLVLFLLPDSVQEKGLSLSFTSVANI